MIGRIILAISIIFIFIKRSELLAAFAKVKWQKGDIEKAIKIFGVADKIGTLGAGSLMIYGYVLLRGGDSDNARTILTRASMSKAKPPVKQRIKSMLALVEWKENNIPLAIEMLEEVIENYKTSMIYQELGLMYILNGDKEKALSFNKEAYEYNSDDLVIVDNLAEAYMLCGMRDEAEKVYEELMEKEPHFPEAYYGYGLLLIDKGEREHGIELIRESLDKRFSFLSVKSRGEVTALLESLEGNPAEK